MTGREESPGRIERWLRGRFPDYPHVVEELYRDTRAAVISWALVAALGVAAVIGLELGLTFVDALRHAGLVIVGLAAAWWPVVGGFDVLAALLWLLLFFLDEQKAKRRSKKLPEASSDYFTGGWVRTLVIVINRHFLHAWALLASAVLLLLVLDRPWQIVLALASLLLLGPMLASWSGLAIARHYRVDHKDMAYADVSWLRRPAFYAATVFSVGLLFVLKGAASYAALVCFSLFVLGAVALRVAAFGLWFRNYRAQERDRATAERRRKFRADLARTTKVHDVLVVGLVLLSPAAFPLLPVFDEQKVARASTLMRVSEWADRASCDVPLGDESWDVQVFLVADNQFRAVNGKPSMGHSPVIDRVVPVAVRPIELDLLSGATLDHFARTYRAAKAKWKNLKWAHLGDFADLGCRSEMNRLEAVVRSFGSDFLGMAPGNHDSYFTGNFAWHPDWTEGGACPGGGPQSRLGKNGTNDHLEKLLLAHKGGKRPLVASERAQTKASEHDFFGRVVPLGTMKLDGKPQPVVAAFLDTSDYSDLVWIGAAGVTGAISAEQTDWVLARLPPNALVVFFQHHPYEALSDGSKERYSEMVNQLNRRLVAIVSAHTHTSQRRNPNFEGRKVPQFVVGSTTDPPQEAALLRLRSTERGYAVDFRTIPAVARKGLACGVYVGPETPPSVAPTAGASPADRGPVAIDEVVCGARLKKLEAECDDLFHCQCGAPFERCECDEDLNPCGHSPETLRAECVGKREDFQTTAEQRDDQEKRAQRLLQCFKARQDEPIGDTPLASLQNPYALLGFNCDQGDAECTQRSENIDLQTDLVCLSWAASVLQGHKHAGWTLHLGARLGLEPLATYAAWASTKEVVWGKATDKVASRP